MLVSVLTILVLLSTLVGLLFRQVQREASLAIDKLQPAAGAAAQVAVGNEAMERGVLAYTITGDPSSLDAFIVGRAESQAALAELDTYVTGADPVVSELLQDTKTSRDRWLYGVAEPRIALVQAGKLEQARRQQTDGLGRRSSAGLRTDVQILSDRIDTLIASKYESLRKINRRLALALILTALMLLGVTVFASWQLIRLVLRPINDLRQQMRVVATRDGHAISIMPRGPPELADMGRDAEFLRQQLVNEIDRARAADEGLAQQSPVVSAIRAELTSPNSPVVPGFAVWGSILPAEGVLAGDWWDVTGLDPTTSALVVMDISGHGAEAGVTGLQLKYRLMGELSRGTPLAASLLAAAGVFDNAPQRFATGTVIRLVAEGAAVEWASAGQHPPLLLNADGSAIWLEPTGPILSALGGDWTTQQTGMAPGAVLLCYTDGLVESRDPDGVELGQDGLLAWCQELRSDEEFDDPATAVERLVNGILSRARNRSPDLRRDDVTVVAVARRPG